MPFLAEETYAIPNKDILSWIFDDIEYDVDKPVYVDAADPTRTVSARRARDIVCRLIAGFKAAGLQRGDCVCIHAFNDIAYSLAFLAIVGAGGVYAGTNPSYTAHELAHAFRTADVKFVLVEPAVLKNVATAAAMTAIPDSNIFLFNPTAQKQSQAGAPNGTVAAEPQMRDWDWLMSQGSSDWERFDDHDTATSRPAARLFSSGTTGLPKALDVTHHNFVAHHTLYMEHPVHAPRRDAAYELRRLVVNPMFHVSQVWRANLTPLRMGHYTVIMRRFETEAWLKCIDEHRISEINVVPAMVNTIVASPVSQKYSFASLRNATSGAAPMTKEQQARLKALMPPKTPLNQVWGMSETGSIGLALYYPEEDTTGSCGRPIPNLDVKLVDEQGTDITAYDTRGELCVRGPTVVSGYYRNPKANASDWDADGWFHTGDVAYCDSQTKLWYIVDRKKELIKVRGFQVAPMEIEGVLLSHPLIVDAAVIGVTLTANGSELPRAYIVLQPGAQLEVADLIAYLAEKLSRFKRPDGGVVIVDRIPKNANGKFLKQKLKEMARLELGLDTPEAKTVASVPRLVEPERETVVETAVASPAVAVVAA
ncbi:acetyl-CoA synthetase-like protein [Saccharata proteae CBS 121410]|uniref:Acetyl-CoA synthetase-like protein n=1 Tax=Saccharata proteae CBS 121410 TaxID=1314787 RepID=A0A6A5YD40_9PEZI|nr:acetyl-CoA synthetase-like protein [Saccharata proteae CBS 121410]